MKDTRKRIAQIGDTSHRLTVVAKPFKKPECKRPIWWVRCRCSCGNETVTRERYFFNGNTKSCGCLRNEAAKRNGDEHRHKGWKKSRTHGQSKTLLYGVWVQMKARCSNPKNKSYARYGRRGIKVCPEWDADFVSFRDWAHAHGYEQGLTIDRIDGDKGYEPSNCQWITSSENSRRVISNRMVQIAALKRRVEELEAKILEARHV